MPRIKEERPGMRSQQYHDALYKEFQKHPDNPFNQVRRARRRGSAQSLLLFIFP